MSLWRAALSLTQVHGQNMMALKITFQVHFVLSDECPVMKQCSGTEFIIALHPRISSLTYI